MRIFARMHRFLPLLLLVAACAGGQSPVSRPSTDPPVPTTAPTTTTAPANPTTTVPETTTTTESLGALTGLGLETVAEELAFPVMLLPSESGVLLATKDGRLYEFDESAGVGPVVLDIRDRVRDGGEQGLLGVAERDGRLFVHYTANNGDTVVSEFTAGEVVILRLEQPASNHNGGMIQFGPDGALYLGLGDGGGAGDRYGHGQNTESLLGGIVRIDVDTGESSLWSYGLRNPWRFWFDGEVLYIGDVGQNAFEEIDVVEFASTGYNFGWPITEGLHCFSPPSGCDPEGITLPVLEVAHGDAGTCSVTGGIVYRGAAIPELVGHYFYSDYCGSWVRSFRWDGAGAVDQRDWEVGPLGRVVSFGIDSQGEVYILTDSAVHRLVPIRSG